MPLDYNEIPKLASHAVLKEHKDFLDGIKIHSKDESLKLVCLHIMFDRWEKNQDHFHIVRTT